MKNLFKKTKSFLSTLFYVVVTLFFLGIFVGSLSFIYFARDLPRPEEFVSRTVSRPTRIYDRTGEHLLYTMHGEERRELTNIENIPDHLIYALLAAEDSNYYDHFGIDMEGIGRSILVNLRERNLSAGGSTISQQLVRSALLTHEKTFMRKVREMILTIELERRHGKDEILEFYFNQIPFGHNVYGIETAAQSFFGKSVSDLTVSESAILVAMIKSPSALSPYGDNLNALIGRRDYVIRRMNQLGSLSDEQMEEALKEEPEFSRFRNYLRAPHFVLQVKQQLEETYGSEFLNQRGLKIYTTLDYEFQRKAENIADLVAEQNRSRFNANNMAIVIVDPNTGEILSMVGSADYYGEKYPDDCVPGKDCLFDPYTNVTLRGRQPGSAFKPIVYAEAFKNGYSGNTVVIDERTNFGTTANPYIPRNYDGKFRGTVTLRESLAQSLNVPSVKVLDEMAGLPQSINFAERLGITTFTENPYHYGLSLVLGGGEIKLLELTSAYGVFATGGLRNPPASILKIEDSTGNVLTEKKSTPRRVLETSVAREITDILSDNEARSPMFGSNSLLHFEDHNVAVKTGSTQNFRDGWAVGYTSNIVVGVWAGNNNNESMRNAPGLSVAGPAWRVLINESIKN